MEVDSDPEPYKQSDHDHEHPDERVDRLEIAELGAEMPDDAQAHPGERHDSPLTLLTIPLTGERITHRATLATERETPVCLFIDNGAKVSLTHRRILAQDPEIKERPPPKAYVLKGYGGQSNGRDGASVARVPIMIGEKRIIIDAFVTEDPILTNEDILIGQSVLGVVVGLEQPIGAVPRLQLERAATTQQDPSSVCCKTCTTSHRAPSEEALTSIESCGVVCSLS